MAALSAPLRFARAAPLGNAWLTGRLTLPCGWIGSAQTFTAPPEGLVIRASLLPSRSPPRVFCMVVASASATHVQCGDTITTATTLDGDVVCPNGAPYGLRIGADNVLLRLNGYAVRAGSGTAPTPGSGIISGPDQDGLSGVRIKRGAVQGFENGVDLKASRTALTSGRPMTPRCSRSPCRQPALRHRPGRGPQSGLAERGGRHGERGGASGRK